MAYEYYQGERHMRGYGHKVCHLARAVELASDNTFQLGTPPIPNIMPQPHCTSHILLLSWLERRLINHREGK